MASSSTTATPADYTSTAINYFSSVRIPASMIAGSALASLFSLTQKTKNTEVQNRSTLLTIVLILYHLLALSSLLLSLNTIITCTAAASSLMFGCDNPIATSPYALMKREYEFEFLMTRWSFYMSLFTLLGAIASRSLIEFDLLHPDRIRSAIVIVSAFAGLFFHLLSFVNERIYCYNNMTEMTFDVVVLWYQKTMASQGICELTSMACFLCSLIAAISLFFRAGKFSMPENDNDHNGKKNN
jgi:hypothetical protein